jgi:hypothetical protein
VDGQRPGGEDPDVLVADFPAVAVRAVQHVDAPPLGQSGDIGELVAGPGRDQDPARRHRPALDPDPEQVIIPFEGVDVAVEDLATVGLHLRAPCGVKDVGGRTVLGQEVVDVPSGRVARVTGIDQQHRAPRSQQCDRSSQPGGAATDHHDRIAVIGLIHSCRVHPRRFI